MTPQILFSPQADEDMYELEAYIRETLKSPFTAAKYMTALNVAIQNLSSYAAAIGANEYIQVRFGRNARHIVFKKMAIVYKIKKNVVYILRVIPGALIY